MFHSPQLDIRNFKHSLTNKVRKLFGLKIEVVIYNCWGGKKSQIPSIEEVCFYLNQAISLCYKSNGILFPEELKKWIKEGITIDYSKLPPDIQQNVLGVLLRSPADRITRKIFINIPK